MDQYPSRILTSLIAMLALIAYAGIAQLILVTFASSMTTFGRISTAIFLQILPIGVLLGWFALEHRKGRYLIPPPEPTTRPSCAAQRRMERRGIILPSVLIPFIAGAPFAVHLLSGQTPGFSAMVPLLVWAWVLRVNGLARMRFAFIYLFVDRITPSDAEGYQDVLKRITAGLVQERRHSKASRWKTIVELRLRGPLVPEIQARATSVPEDPALEEPEEIVFDERDILALQAALTGDGNPYRLLGPWGLAGGFSLDDMSFHERMSCLKDLKEAREKADAIFDAQPARPARGLSAAAPH